MMDLSSPIALIKKCLFCIQTQFSTNLFNAPNSTLYSTSREINLLTFRKNYAKPYCSGELETPPLLDCGLRGSGGLRFSPLLTSHNNKFKESPSARDISQIFFRLVSSSVPQKFCGLPQNFCSTRETGAPENFVKLRRYVQ